MRKNQSLFIASALAVGLAAVPARAQNLLLNGTFDVDTASGFAFDISVKRQDDAGFPANRHLLDTGAAGAGWFSTWDTNSFEIWDETFNPNWNTGTHLELQDEDSTYGTSTFQDFSATSTGLHELSVLYGYEGQTDASAPFDIVVRDLTNGVDIFQQTVVANMDAGAAQWQDNVWSSFSANVNLFIGNQYRMSFVDARPNTGEYAQTHLDNASVVFVSSIAPEPGTLALFGLAGWVGLLKRRRR